MYLVRLYTDRYCIVPSPQIYTYTTNRQLGKPPDTNIYRVTNLQRVPSCSLDVDLVVTLKDTTKRLLTRQPSISGMYKLVVIQLRHAYSSNHKKY